MKGEQTNTSSPSTADVKQGSCTFIPPIRLHGVKEITFKELELYYYYYYIFYEFLSLLNITELSCFIIPPLHSELPISEVYSVYANLRELPQLKTDNSCRSIRKWTVVNQYCYNVTREVTDPSDNHNKSVALCIAYCMGFE
jgi:hypothetical protein